jgi:hypothetical protein
MSALERLGVMLPALGLTEVAARLETHLERAAQAAQS